MIQTWVNPVRRLAGHPDFDCDDREHHDELAAALRVVVMQPREASCITGMGGGIINYVKIGVRQLEMESYRTFRQSLPVFDPGADNLHHVCPMYSEIILSENVMEMLSAR